MAGNKISKVKTLKKAVNYQKEIDRVKCLYKYENIYYLEAKKLIAGIDEVGRGPLAGPVIAASVILPPNFHINGINDSKKISVKKREVIFDIIKEKALSIGIGIIDEGIIDEINILNATKLAMKRAIADMDLSPNVLLIDAIELKDINIKQLPIIKGDTKSASIAAASIIAKVTRDRIMMFYNDQYPEYGFIRNKGYGTREHIEALLKYGKCQIHRNSFIKNFV